MRLLRVVLIGCLMLSLFGSTCVAQEYVQQQLEQSGANDLWERLDEDTKALYREVGVENLADLSEAVLSPLDFFDQIGELLRQHGGDAFSVLGILLACVVLCAYLGGLKETIGNGEIRAVYQNVCVLTVCGVATIPFMECIRRVQAALSGAGVFMGSFAPVYITTLAAGGQIRTALSYQTVVLLFSQVLTRLAEGLLLPLLLVGFAFGVVSSSTDTVNLSSIGKTILKAVSWCVGIMGAVFTTLLTVNGMLGAAGDTLGSRMVKLSLACFVPVVGGALSEAFLTVKGCIGVVRTTVGAFGMISTVLLILPALIQCVCWQLCFWLADMAAETFGENTLSAFLKTAQQVTKTMIALLSICALFMMIATAIVSKGVTT